MRVGVQPVAEVVGLIGVQEVTSIDAYLRLESTAPRSVTTREMVSRIAETVSAPMATLAGSPVARTVGPSTTTGVARVLACRERD